MSLDDKSLPEDEPWDPKKEIQPDQLQAEALSMLRDMIEERRQDKEEREARKRELADLERGTPCPPSASVSYTPPPRPTFEQISERMAKAWEGTRRIAPDAPPQIQQDIFRSLLQTQGDGMPFAGGF
jgi:hypothetical protein